jgi:hypothetical protein
MSHLGLEQPNTVLNKIARICHMKDVDFVMNQPVVSPRLGGSAGVSFFLVSEATASLAIKVGTVKKHKKMSQAAHFG